ncbi:MAG: hypothetical protein RIF41_28560 [Polyangiaceae bacterium]
MADERANAVGPVRLTCLPQALRVELLRVGRFAAGFAFIGLADAVSFEVPYTAVRGMVRQGALLHLSLDPHAATPYNRFSLTRFSRDPMSALMRSFRLRAWLMASRFVLPPVAAAVAAWAVPAQMAGGIVGRLAVGLVVLAAVSLVVKRGIDWLVGGGATSDELAGAFERAVSVRLGLVPATDRSGAPLGEPRRDGVIRSGLIGAGLAPRLFALVGMLAVGMALMAVVAVQRYGVADEVLLPVDLARAGITQPMLPVVPRAVDEGTPDHEGCHCVRGDEALWRGPLPQVSVVVSPVAGSVEGFWLRIGETYAASEGRLPRDGDEDDEAGPRIEFDLAAINNSTEPVETVDFVVTFARRDQSGRRRALLERGLHWPGTLDPGEAIKWRVEASDRTELKVDSRLDATISDSMPMASNDQLAALQRASLPSVRLHGAMLLAYRGDPRAQALLERLDGLPPAEEAIRQRILGTFAPLKVCDLRPAPGGGVTFCAHNGSERLERRLVLQTVDREGRREDHELEDLFLPGRGLVFELPLDAEALPDVLTLAKP